MYLPNSKAGEAMGESSVVIVKMPSNFRSGKGWVTSADIRARTLGVLSGLTAEDQDASFSIYLVPPNRTSASPCSSPKLS